MKKLSPIVCALLITASACSPIGAVVGAGATVGTAALEERGIEGSYDDAKIQFDLNNILYAQDKDLLSKVDFTVREGKVLLTGLVETPEMRQDAEQLAWRAEGGREIVNEIEINTQPGLLDMGKDVMVYSEVWAKLTLDEEIDSINFAVNVTNGSVYVMGIARHRAELDKVLAHAQNVKNVKRVVDLVRIKDQYAQSTGSSY